MIYADYNSTSPVLPAVYAAMQPYLLGEFGNPSAVYHELGQRARAAVEAARDCVAGLINASPEEVVFLSGGTESCFQALIGSALAGAKGTAYSSAVEHPAVLEALNILGKLGLEVKLLPVSARGDIEMRDAIEAVKGAPFVSLMLANNETGIRYPVDELVRGLAGAYTITHTDATQAIGRIPVDFRALGCDLLSFSGHKLGAPKGIGVLVVRKGCRWSPPMKGGGQEGGRRGGTEAVPLIVGMGEAAKAAIAALQQGESGRLEHLRDSFEHALRARISGIKVNGAETSRLPNTSNVTIRGINGLELVRRLGLEGIVISAGSACKTSDLQPSHVLSAMGLSVGDSLSTLRISFGGGNSPDDVSNLVNALENQVKELRQGAEDELRSLLRR